ncbi:ECF RNA polymerase sigma factor SigR [Phycisphaerae bacterium RAS1]|nr:ECF RNA polymerase sigma factor SigR [Phycisphaerae bacterium RAS1]
MPVRDDKSFEALALPHAEAIYRFARRLTRDEHEAEDLVQEAYLKAYKAFGRFEEREFGVRPWLLKILYNAFLNRQVRAKRTPVAADQQALDQIHADSGDLGSESPPELDYERVDEEVKRAIDALPVEFRSVLLLWASMEMSYQEIADTLSVPIGTVMSRLHRGRQQVIRSLSNFAKEQRLTPASRSDE